MGLIKPIDLAKKLNEEGFFIRPQRIYGLIKNGRINTQTDGEGKLVIDEEKARLVIRSAVRGANGQAPRQTSSDSGGKKAARKTGISRGTIVSWDIRKGKGERRVGQVDEVGEQLTYVRTTDRDRIAFITGSLDQRILRGQIAVEHPTALLELVARQMEINNLPDVARDLRELLGKHRDVIESRPKAEPILNTESEVAEERLEDNDGKNELSEGAG
jgi:hypothetical protein